MPNDVIFSNWAALLDVLDDSGEPNGPLLAELAGCGWAGFFDMYFSLASLPLGTFGVFRPLSAGLPAGGWTDVNVLTDICRYLALPA